MNNRIDFVISKLCASNEKGIDLKNILHKNILVRGQYCISRDHMIGINISN